MEMTKINFVAQRAYYDFAMLAAIPPTGSDDDQAAVIDFLADPTNHGNPPDGVQIIETHGAMVFLAGDRALKLKKSVRFPYLDFSTVEKRRRACLREFELNQPHAPTIYVAVSPVARRPDGHIAIGSDGEAIDWIVEMRRFPQGAVLAAEGKLETLNPEFMDCVGAVVAKLHTDAVAGPRNGGADRFSAVVDSVLSSLVDAGDIVDPVQSRVLAAALRRKLNGIRRILDFRSRTGFVRRCHGDLHLGNIVDIGGEPLPFDALEFDEELATTDTLYDLAFLLMDLDVRGQRAMANRMLNRYLTAANAHANYYGLSALPAFIALRAAIRVRVLVDRARQDDGGPPNGVREDAQRVMSYALDVLKPAAPIVIGIGGLSGSGKSALARNLAPLIGRTPGAVVLRSDVERKAMYGLDETRRLGQEAYGPGTSERVYARLYRKARLCLMAGHSVIVDAVHQQPDERHALAQLAHQAGAPFVGYWLSANEDTLVERIARRARTSSDASDATPEVVRMQLERDTGAVGWARIDSGGAPEHTLRSVVLTLNAAHPNAVARDTP